MPFKVKGNQVWHYKSGKWTVKQTCKSPGAAQAAMRLLEGIDHNPEFAEKIRNK